LQLLYSVLRLVFTSGPILDGRQNAHGQSESDDDSSLWQFQMTKSSRSCTFCNNKKTT